MSGLLSPNQFAGDDGQADPALAIALQRYGLGEVPLQQVVAALAGARVLVPVVAVLGESGASSLTGLTSDKNADMALVLLKGDQGRQALPLFSSLATLQRWNPSARPVPVESRRAALSGVDEGCETLVVDPAGPVTAVLNRPATWALAQGRRWLPSPDDPDVQAAIKEALGEIATVQECRCEPGESAELRLVVRLVPGLNRTQLDQTTTLISTALSRVEVVAERVASLELRLR
ncbi:MAG: SseB family protein [Actinomycetales bacterium]